ncbi:angiotensinogen [Aplochiton taeniatus]
MSESRLLLTFLLCCCFSAGYSNRVYVHPFYMFASENVSCETLQTTTAKPFKTLTVTPLGSDNVTPDSRSHSDINGSRQNVTKKTGVLAELLNSLGLRMYQTLSSRQSGNNTLFSPVNTFGSLVTFYLGASKKTAIPYQMLLGLHRDSDQEDCVSLVDGHQVLKTLQSINSLVDGARDEIHTRVWVFTRRDARLSEDFVQGTRDFSDASFLRGVDFAGAAEAERQVNAFVEKTSGGAVKNVFKDVGASANFLYLSSVRFQGNWRTAFQPERTSMQDFHVDPETTVTVPLMTHTGRYRYLDDRNGRCTVVKLPLSKRTYMLLVLPHEGASLRNIENKLRTDVISDWYQNLREGLLELSLPKFSMSSQTDVRDLLTFMSPKIEEELLGSKATFVRLSTHEPFTIDKVFNQVTFEMTEEGAEPQERNQEEGVALKLSVNRPFLFTVVEGDSSSILMLGKVTNPSL